MDPARCALVPRGGSPGGAVRGKGLRYGDAAFTAEDIARVFRDLQIVILPCANPDGRVHSQTQEPLWRKNRSTNVLPSGGTCRGVDLNRNFDVAWDFRRTIAPEGVKRVG